EEFSGRMQPALVRPYSPESNGKVERLIRTIDDECYAVHHPCRDRVRGMGRWLWHYNYERSHLSLKGLTRFNGARTIFRPVTSGPYVLKHYLNLVRLANSAISACLKTNYLPKFSAFGFSSDGDFVGTPFPESQIAGESLRLTRIIEEGGVIVVESTAP